MLFCSTKPAFSELTLDADSIDIAPDEFEGNFSDRCNNFNIGHTQPPSLFNNTEFTTPNKHNFAYSNPQKFSNNADFTNISKKQRQAPVEPASFNSMIDSDSNRLKISCSITDDDIIDSPEPHISNPNQHNFEGSEIILTAGTHYNPIRPNNEKNFERFIVTAGPCLTKSAPLFFNWNDITVGAVVARGQLTFLNGQPNINKDTVISPNQDELHFNSILLTAMIDPSSVPGAPLKFNPNHNYKSNPLLMSISNCFNSLCQKFSYNFNKNNNFVNSNNSFNFNHLNNSKNFNHFYDFKYNNYNNNHFLLSNSWYCQTNVMHNAQNFGPGANNANTVLAVNVVPNTVEIKSHVNNHSVKVDTKMIESKSRVDNHFVLVDTNMFESNVHVDNHFVSVGMNNIGTNARVDNHIVNGNPNVIESNAHFESHVMNIKANITNSNARVEHHTVTVNFNIIQSLAKIDNHSVVVDQGTTETMAHVENHKEILDESTTESVVHVENHSVVVDPITVNSIAHQNLRSQNESRSYYWNHRGN